MNIAAHILRTPNKAIGIICSFILGACAATTAQSVASDGGSAGQQSSGTATVVQLADAPVRQVGGGKAQITLLAQGKNAFVGKFEMAAGGKVPEHRDATEEYIHVLSGSGTIYVEGVATKLRAGATVYMPANAKVRYENGPEKLVALQVFAGPAPAAKYNKWQPVGR